MQSSSSASSGHTGMLLNRSSKTLTPQRKHRKMLKDGTSEVWPESVERIFVEGLREYWGSPWATFSRGRSRWRNQFLVDYLQKAGIPRSKKQVASHIQVLRNMWKGEPEYQLVAGGEELLLETGFPSPHVKKRGLNRRPMSPNVGVKEEAMSTYSLSSPSTAGSPDSEFHSEAPVYRPHSLSHSPSPGPPLPIASGRVTAPHFPRTAAPADAGSIGAIPFVKTEPSEIFFISQPSPGSTAVESNLTKVGISQCQSTGALRLFNVEGARNHYSRGNLTAASPPMTPLLHTSPNSDVNDPLLAIPPPYPYSGLTSFPAAENRMTGLCLWADGMPSFNVDLDSLGRSNQTDAPRPSRLSLQIRLCVSTMDDMRSPPTFHGFQAAISLSAPWASSGRCITTTWEGNMCYLPEQEVLTEMATGAAVTDSSTSVSAFLPESWLNRCKWLNAGLHSRIVQQIIVDDDVLAVISYDVDRSANGGLPSVELVNFQRHEFLGPSPAQLPTDFPHPSNSASCNAAHAELIRRSRTEEPPSRSHPYLSAGSRANGRTFSGGLMKLPSTATSIHF